MSNKRGIQLSISFIVIIILSIVVFSFGIYFLHSIFTEAQEMKQNIDQRTEAEIERLLDDGSRVAIPHYRKTIARGHGDVFGLGILNVVGEEEKFDITVECEKLIKPDKIEDVCGDVEAIMISNQITLQNNERRTIKILINVPRDAESGTYIFNVGVSYGGEAYDTMKKIYVEV